MYRRGYTWQVTTTAYCKRQRKYVCVCVCVCMCHQRGERTATLFNDHPPTTGPVEYLCVSVRLLLASPSECKQLSDSELCLYNWQSVRGR